LKLTPLSTDIAAWLQQLAADHDGVALIVAKTVGSLMIEDGPKMWFKLNRISDLTGLSPGIVAAILYRLRHRQRLYFKRRGDRDEGVDPEFQFILPRKMPKPIERDRVWRKMEVKQN
jgi:hypothetical protein